MKKIIVGILGLVMLMTAAPIVSASSTWNGASNDCPSINIANYSTSSGFGDPCWTSTNISANPGETINVRIYYHNTSGATAANTIIRLNAPSGSSTNQSFSAQITSSQGNLSTGSVSVNIPSSQTITFGSTRWYPNQSQNSAAFLNGQSGSEVISNGLNIGSIDSNWSSQGSVVVSFHVSNSVAPQLCQDSSATNYGSALPCTYAQKVCTINSFTSNPSTITLGDSSTLSWDTTNCVSAAISQIGTVNVSGSSSVYPTQTTSYQLTAYGANGIPVVKNTNVTVNQVQKTCVLNSFTANPTSITKGDTSTLSWSTTDCANVTISNLNYNVPTNGTQAVYPTQTTTYMLVASGVNGINAQTKSVTINVTSAPQLCQDSSATNYGSALPCTYPPSKVCVVNSFTAVPVSISSGDSSTLNWSTTNCANVVISNLSYSLPMTGAQDVWPTQTITYTLTARSLSGEVAPTKTATVYVSAKQVCADPSASNYNGALPCTYPPQVCKDSTATNYGGALPCTYPQKVCSISNFSANPTSITTGDSSTLNWSTIGCDSVTISNLGYGVPTSGTQTVFPAQTTTYTLTAQNSTGAIQERAITVYVSAKQVCADPSATNYGGALPCTYPQKVCSINNFTASPTSITSGDSSSLNWSTTDCTNVTISNLGYNVPTTGTQAIWPTQTTTYTLAATGATGVTLTRAVTVYVNQPTVCSINSFSGSPTSIKSGESSTLSWNTTNCTSVSISNLGYNVPTTGTQTVWPTQTTTYTLTAVSAGGVTQTRDVTVYVSSLQLCEDPTAINYQGTLPCTYVIIILPTDKCSITDFTASDTSISDGDSSTLEWDTNNCDNVKISSIGSVSDSGSRKVYPSDDTTYTLTAYNTDGTHVSDTVRIYVDDNNNDNNNDCSIDSFTASNTYINSNDPVTLRWSTTGCNSVNISNLGNVSLDGSRTVYPTSNTTYVLNAYGDNSVSRSLYVNVNYQQILPIAPIYNTNVVTTIATNISQTGAQLNGLITNTNYSNTNVYFEYGTDINLGQGTSPRLANGNTNFNDIVTNLSPNTIYYFQAVSNGSNGISRGSIEVFKTLGYTAVNTNTNTNYTDTTQNTTRQVVVQQGITLPGSTSPIVLRIENKYQTIGVGDTVDYVVYYKNISSSVLTHPMVQVTIPKGLTLLNASRGTYSQDGNILSAPIEDLYPDAEGVIYIQARVDSIDANLAQIVTTAVLVYTNPNGAQENAMAYVLNNPRNVNLLGASAFFGGNILGLGLIGWLIIIILIMLLILAARSYERRNNNIYYPSRNNIPPQN